MQGDKSMAYCKALDLAQYVATKYKNKYKAEISSLKLQKSLYFLFAYWGGFVRKGKGKTTELKETLKEKLFDDKIQAWTYGPVVPNVYHAGTINSASDIVLHTDIKEFVDGLCDEMFEISDFKLVEIAHRDKCWQDHYDDNEEFHNNEIPKEEIISEYALKI